MLSQNMFELALLAVQKRFNLLHDNLGSKNQETMVNQSINEFRLAQRDLPVIKINSPDDEDGQGGNDSEEEDIDNSVTTQFSEKANSLLAYIDKTYLLVIVLFYYLINHQKSFDGDSMILTLRTGVRIDPKYRKLNLKDNLANAE